MTLPPAAAAPQLPASEQVDVGLLAEAFSSFTASYKILLLRAILHRIEQNRDNPAPLVLTYDEIRSEMLVNAWFPCRRFRLDFGYEDRLAGIFTKLELAGFLDGEARITASKIRTWLRRNPAMLNGMRDLRKLTRYPVFTMLRPWFKEFRSIKEPRRQIAERSVARFDGDRPPPYKITKDGNGEQIAIHPKWRAYFHANMDIVEGWLDSKWLRFLERRNPNVPTISSKLWDRPSRARNLSQQHEFWDAFLAQNQLRCIYSRQPVRQPYALDHFLPWTWVGHNQLWNLIPASKGINSDKSDRLPAGRLIRSLASAHFQALDFAFKTQPQDWKKKLIDDYRFGLRANDEILRDANRLRNAYAATVEPLLSLARTQGFVDWRRRGQ